MMFPHLVTRSTLVQRWLGHQHPALLRLFACISVLLLCIALADQVVTTIRVREETSTLVAASASAKNKTAQLLSSDGSLSKAQSQKIKPDLTLTEEQRRGLNTVIRQLNTPWQDMFDQLEAATNTDIALISIEPDAKRATVRLVAEAKRVDTLFAYASELQQQGVFGRLTYSKHETNDQDSNKPVRLSFELDMQMPQRLTLKKDAANR